MRKKPFISRFRALPGEKQLLAISSLLTILFLFLPWYGINNFSVNELSNAFETVASVGGTLIALFSLGILLLIGFQVFRPESDFLQKLPLQEKNLLLFFSAQSLFVALIFIPVLIRYSFFDRPDSGTRFGIYLTLIATLISTLASLSFQKKAEQGSEGESRFANLPRTQRSLTDITAWNEEEKESTIQTEQPTEMEAETKTEKALEQETIFDSDHAQQKLP